MCGGKKSSEQRQDPEQSDQNDKRHHKLYFPSLRLRLVTESRSIFDDQLIGPPASTLAGLVRCIGHACLICHPVHLPGLATVLGVGLLEVWIAGVGIGPNEADVDRLVVQFVYAIKFAASILESTNLGAGIHDAVFAVRPINAPLACLRVVEAQRQSLDVAAGTIEFDLLDHGTSIPYLARDEGAIELNPGFRSGEGMIESFEVGLPGTQGKVEVVLAIPLRCSSLRAAYRCGRGCLSQAGFAIYDEKQR